MGESVSRGYEEIGINLSYVNFVEGAVKASSKSVGGDLKLNHSPVQPVAVIHD